MFTRLLLLFLLVPLIEIVLLIEIGKRIGALATIALVVITAVTGAALARREGLGVLDRIRRNLSIGVMPGQELFHGFLILVAGLLLLTPGFLTDCTGFLLLVPAVRNTVLKRITRSLKSHLDKGPVEFRFFR